MLLIFKERKKCLFLFIFLCCFSFLLSFPANASEVKEKELSILFYLDSQKSMPNEFSLKALEDMAAMGSDENINIVFQIGCVKPSEKSSLDKDDENLLGPVAFPQTKGVRRYVISSEKKAAPVETLPEDTVMDSGASIKDFISWAMKNYNSRHYIVIIMEHGHAWKGFKLMTFSELADTIKEAVKDGNKATGDNDKIDVLYLQSCLMGSIEAVSGLEETAHVLMTSENPIYAFSNRDFDLIFAEIKQNIKGFSPKKFASSTVEIYKTKNKDNVEKLEGFRKDEKFKTLFSLKCESRVWFKEVRRIFMEENGETCRKLVELLEVTYGHGYPTLSAIDTEKLPQLTESLREFVNLSITYGLTNKQFFSAIEHSVDYGNGNKHNYTEHLHDLGNIMKNLVSTEGLDPKIKESAQKVIQSLNEAVINEQHDPLRMKGSTGLSIWSPVNALDILMTQELYNEIGGDFIEKTGWNSLIEQGIKNLPCELQEELAGMSELIKETNELLVKLEKDTSLSRKEKMEMAKKIVENKKIIYSHEVDMILSKH